jgi:hypothetical protein
MVAGIIYVLCALTSLTSMALLLRGYALRRVRLLLWSGLCFAGLTANNLLLLVDLFVMPDVDLYFVRQIPALAGVLLLVYGLIWEVRD